MTSGPSSLRFLYSLQKSGIKAGLGNIRFLLDTVDNPQGAFPTVHVAGTNGKGSTAAMIAAVLTAAGYRTGLYTSPHLVRFTERIRIDGRKIPIERVAAYTRRLAPEVRRCGATFFEATTAIAFQYFADEEVDLAVIETGLGGRWDSTNVITPLVSVITSIGLEHREYLGGTIRKIAFEKAGIIKPGIPCVVGEVAAPALEVIAGRAEHIGARIVRAASAYPLKGIAHGPEGFTADVRLGRKTISRLHVGAAGLHQEDNLRLALAALDLIGKGEGRFPVGEQSIRKGLSSVGPLAGFAGRLQILRSSPVIIADVAHNPDGTGALVGSLRVLTSGKFRIVFGVMEDKDYRTMIDHLLPLCRMFYFTRPETARSRDPVELLDYAHQHRAPARMADTVRGGIQAALKENHASGPLLVTGSHYTVGEAMKALQVHI